ncbi:MAG: CheY-like chemotaxis protein [Flavobacteriales bacterium]|jgi:CheY-like chemotaxis protein
MPNMGGLEFLMRGKKSNRLNYMPALVFTTSDYKKDKRETFRLGVSRYFVNPISLKAYEQLLNKISSYWEKSEIPE